MPDPVYYDTLAPGEISEELAPVIDELGLRQNCTELLDQGYTVIHDVASAEFTHRLRDAILAHSGPYGGARMLLARDPVYAEAVLSPKLLAMAEFSVGRGHSRPPG